MNEAKSIAKSALLVTLMMLCFKFVAFGKQAVIAYYYGATVETDTYFIAWGFVSGISEAIVKALAVSVVAIYTTIRVTKGTKEAASLINGLIEIVFPLFLLLCCVVIVFSPKLAWILAPAYNTDELTLLITFMQILAPLFLFSGIEFIFSSVLDSYKSFFYPRLHSFIYSIVVIAACVFLSALMGINALIISQYISNIVFLVILIINFKRYHNFFVVKIAGIPELKTILFTAIPLFIGNSALQINQIVDKSITSGLGAGATSALSYCHTIEQFITNIMIVNIGNVMFANFAEFVAKGDLEKIKINLFKAINFLICLLTGISIFTILNAKDIVSIIYFRGNFTFEAVVLTATALCGYAISFVGVAVRDLSVKSLYAFKDTRKPMMASIVSILVNITFSIILSKHIGILGVSLATSISVVVGMILNAYALKEYLTDYRYLKHLTMFFKCLPAGCVLLFVCLFFEKFFISNMHWRFLFSGIAGFTVYFFVLYLSGISEIRDMFKIIKNKIFV